MSKPRIGIIGAGVAGLACSARLAHRGYEVHVFEANEFPGGKINRIQLGPYQFDRGPSVLTGLNYLEEVFDFCGEPFEFPLVQTQNSFRYFFPDGIRLQLGTNPEDIAAEIAIKLGEDRRNVSRYLRKAESNYRHIAPLFIEKSLHRKRSLIGKKLIKALVRLPWYKLARTMHTENQARFRNPKTVQVFDRFASYNGSHPYRAPAMLNMISHLEMNEIPFLPAGGMIQVTNALYELAKNKGVQFHFKERVRHILLDQDRCNGLETSKGNYSFDAVVSNMDVSYTYERLLDSKFAPHKVLDQELSSSAVVFYWGIRTKFDQLDLHNIFFGDSYQKEFDTIFAQQAVQNDPTIYVNVTSKYITGDAPDGCDNWFVMINSPVDNGQDWEKEVAETRTRILERLSNELGESIEDLIEVEQVLTPPMIDRIYAGKSGSIYGNASNSKYAAFYRHPNFSKNIQRLYFAGVSVHPGGGIPLALNSARLACEFLENDLISVTS